MAKPPARAATPPAPDPAPETAVSQYAAAAVPAFLQAKAEADAGKGTSQAQEDNIVPLIYVLQAQSPQCNQRSPDYVQDAVAGSIWLRTSGLPAIDGEDGILFQPCYFHKDWVEWIPNRGGYVARHAEKPADAVQKPDPKNADKLIWKRANGNDLVETRYHVGFVILEDRVMPYVIPMAGSQHSVSRQWMFLMNAKQMPGLDGPPPSWASKYRLTTRFRSNDQGEWYTLDVADAGWIETEAEYARGLKLHEAFVSGEMRAEAEVQAGSERSVPEEGAAM